MEKLDEEVTAAVQGSGTDTDGRLDEALADTFPASDPPACILRSPVNERSDAVVPRPSGLGSGRTRP